VVVAGVLWLLLPASLVVEEEEEQEEEIRHDRGGKSIYCVPL
jgi:hypothetical protein